MAEDISIITRLKKIAVTSLELGREIARDQLNQGRERLNSSSLGDLYRQARSRLGLDGSATGTRKKQRVQDELTFSKKRPLGSRKYSAKTARLSHS